MSHSNRNLWLLTQPNSTKQQLSCSPGSSSGWLLWDILHLPLGQTRQAPLSQLLIAAHVQLAAITSSHLSIPPEHHPPILGGIQAQAGWDPGQLDLVGHSPVHGRQLEHNDL